MVGSTGRRSISRVMPMTRMVKFRELVCDAKDHPIFGTEKI